MKLLLLLVCFSGYHTVPLANDVTINKDTGINPSSLSYLLSKGYYTPPKASEVGQIQANQEKIASALEDFQRYAHIQVTGKMDDATKEMMAKPRCGMPDVNSKGKGGRRKKRYVPQGTKWSKNVLTWALENSNNDKITDGQIRNVMQRSFAKWAAVTNLKFIERIGLPIRSTDIRVRFETGSHSDPYPFDGRGGTLAHAFYPLDNKGLSGDVHFDDDEIYTIKSNDDRSKRKLMWIAVHELGHSIGLDHSDLKGAVMYPWYQHFEGEDFDLTEDDVRGIQSIYGSRVKPVTTAPALTKNPLPVIGGKCIDRIGAALSGRDRKNYIFNDNVYYTLHTENKGIMGIDVGPKPVNSLFKGIANVDALFQRDRDNSIVIFHGNKFTVFDVKTLALKSKARKISDGFQRLSEGFGDVDASFVWSKNNKLYIFKGENYWRFSGIFNSNDYVMDKGYPKRIAFSWHGLPKSIDAVFQWNNGRVYFFKDDMYYRWDERSVTVQSGYPQKISNTFLECTKGSFVMQRETKSNAILAIPSSLIILISFLWTGYFAM